MIYDSSESFSKASCSLSNQALQGEEVRLVDYVPVLPIALSHALSRPVPFSKFECLLSAQAVFGMRSLQIKDLSIFTKFLCWKYHDRSVKLLNQGVYFMKWKLWFASPVRSYDLT